MIEFKKSELTAEFMDTSGRRIKRDLEIRTDPISLRTCRILPSRAMEKERGQEGQPAFPDADLDRKKCPFCQENLTSMTPCLLPEISSSPRLTYNKSVLFPNLFPYTEWSAVSLFDDTHYVEIGSAELNSYRDSFINCANYLSRVKQFDPEAVYMSITQNHLPGAGGSLVHPHLQVHASKSGSNNHLILEKRANAYQARYGKCIISDLLTAEKRTGKRYIGTTGTWEWMAAFAPSGFYEIWGISRHASSLLVPDQKDLWQDLAQGVLNVQQFYKSLNRNSYNLALISIENEKNIPCLKVSITARSNFAPWVRSDFTGFDIASGEMATFTRPEAVKSMAEKYWKP